MPECGKSRLLHAAKKVSEKLALHSFLENVSYSCGSSLQDLLDEDEEIISSIYIQADITCNSIMELPYYSAKYPDVCIQCGGSNSLKVKEGYYPLCDKCISNGEKPTKRRTRAKFQPKE